MSVLFDMKLRSLRRDRAARAGPELFLLERAFADCLDRLDLVNHRFARALLVGCPDPGWRDRLRQRVQRVDAIDPGAQFALASSGERVDEDAWDPPFGIYDLVVAVGTLDTVNDLPRALLALRASMTAQGFFLGAMSGGDTLPRLRAAMRAADEQAGAATPHVHPRIEASALAPLLASAGFANPVVDVDRVQVSYRSLASLADDLRGMGATNLLISRSRTGLSSSALAAAEEKFLEGAIDRRATEVFEILHFAGWSPPHSEERTEG